MVANKIKLYKNMKKVITPDTMISSEQILTKQKRKQEHSDIGPSAYFAKLGKKKVNEEKEIEKPRK